MFNRNQDIREAKGPIPIWAIAERLGVHENTLRNWMKKEMNRKQKIKVISAITDIKKELANQKEGVLDE
ncbi:transposase [Peribacillus frigoritolerans]|uniref:transposase n=1 Tax=Peribacillus TaxID=2675229 RepID=UPI00366137BB